MWLIGGGPNDMTLLLLDINNATEISMVEAMLTEKHLTTINKPNTPCRSYSSEDFNACSQNFLKTQLNKILNCTLPGKSVLT